MPKRSSKQQGRVILDSDLNELAASIVDRATSEGKNPAAVALGRLGGKKGGKARATKLTAAERSDIARKAALARWHKSK